MLDTLEAPQITLSEGLLAAYQTTTQTMSVFSVATNAGRPRLLNYREADAVLARIAADGARLRDAWLEAWEVLETDELSEPFVQDCGERLRRLFTDWRKLMASVQFGAEAMAARGLPLSSMPLLQLAAQQAEQLQKALEDTWPWRDRPGPQAESAMAQRSREQIGRGEGMTVEDAIRELEALRHSGS
jgi:hypothetical protein